MKLNIKTSEFTVDTEDDSIYNLFELSIKKAGNTNKLSEVLIKNYKIRRYKKRTLIDNLRKWQSRRTKQTPLDVFLSLCKFTNHICEIKGLRLINCRLNLNTNYPIKLNKSFAFISECVKVEGNLTKNSIALENTNTELTSKFKKELINIGIEKRNIKESLHIKIQIPENVKKKEIKIVNLTKHKRIKQFHERILNLSLGNKKEVVFEEADFSYNKNLDYRVFYKCKSFDVEFKIPTNGKIYTKSTLNDSRYQKICVSLRLKIHNKTLAYLLHKCFKIPYGNKSRIIGIPLFIKNSSKEIQKEIVNATLAAESTLTTKSRFIAICSLSKDYLNDFQFILQKFNINSRLNKNTLKICGIKNFRKINENFDPIIKTKKKSLNELLKTKIEQSQKGLAKLFYLKSLNGFKKATWTQIINDNGRVGHSLRKYLYELLNDGYINLIKDSWPREYILTKKGKNLLNKSRALLK